MYHKLPNLIIGFHGCDIATYENVLQKQSCLLPSKNTWDWLGHGIYFWENNYERALDWANEKVKRGEYTAPKVIGAVIDLGFCLNLTDSAYTLNRSPCRSAGGIFKTSGNFVLVPRFVCVFRFFLLACRLCLDFPFLHDIRMNEQTVNNP